MREEEIGTGIDMYVVMNLIKGGINMNWKTVLLVIQVGLMVWDIYQKSKGKKK